MISMLPAPRWLELGRAFLSGAPDPNLLSAPWSGPNDLAFWLSRSAWSLRAVADWRRALGTDGPVCVWVPDFFCDQTLGGLREAGDTLVFYPVTDGRAPDWTACKELARSRRPDVFVLVHYFGLAGPAKAALEFSRRYGAALVEDCAHCLLPDAGIGRTGDFALFSPHKLLALPDGAVLVARPSAARFAGNDAARLGAALHAVISQLPGGRRGALGWLVRRLLMGWQPRILTRWRRGRQALLPLQGGGRPGLPWSSTVSELSLRLLAQALPQLEAEGGLRVEHAAQMKARLSAYPGLRCVAPVAGEGVPYWLGVQLKTENETLTLRERLLAAGLPAATWPDLPPEVLADPDRHATTLDLWRTTLYLPVHQRLDVVGWLEAAGFPRVPLPSTGVEVDWSPSEVEWADCFRRAPRSSLLQSRAYVRAKQRTGRCKSRFGLVRQAGRPVATIAVLDWGRLRRINRGPCWIEEGGSCGLVHPVFTMLRRQAGWRQGRLLLIAPNAPLQDGVLDDLCGAGLHRRRTACWHSSWLDLRRSEEELLAALDGKWRNQMAAARKAGLAVEVTRAPEALEWLVDRHEEMKAERGIDGPAAALLRALRTEVDGVDEELIVLRAGPAAAPVAGVLLARHGTSATYLVGWTSDEGRRGNASNLLLWESVKELQRTGCSWFDLCGLDERRTRGITAFKRGMGGEEYRLAGEYWAG